MPPPTMLPLDGHLPLDGASDGVHGARPFWAGPHITITGCGGGGSSPAVGSPGRPRRRRPRRPARPATAMRDKVAHGDPSTR